ncbi:nose resistant to fluoxetine protein 6 [Trichonephila clavipes]|nr:nose resistant to fluoxetine protein 6 [Trichonephila clavipes]
MFTVQIALVAVFTVLTVHIAFIQILTTVLTVHIAFVEILTTVLTVHIAAVPPYFVELLCSSRGFINTVLSWKAWVPLSKLVFVTYLIQPIIQLNYIASFRAIQEFTHLQFIVQGFGFLVISTFLGFLCNMLIESPCLCIENNFFNPESKTEETNEANNLGFENDDIKIKMKGKTEMMLTLENGLDHKKLFKTDNENTKSLIRTYINVGQMLTSLTNPKNLNNFSWHESQFLSAMMPDESDVDDEIAPDPVLRRVISVCQQS